MIMFGRDTLHPPTSPRRRSLASPRTRRDARPSRRGAEARRRQRVCGLARLRNDDGEAVPVDRRLAVAVFRSDVDLDRKPRDDGELTRGVRMRVGFARLAVRCPPGVADADGARERGGGELGLEVLELAL